MATWSPAATNASAIALPIPRFPPVTSTDLLTVSDAIGYPRVLVITAYVRRFRDARFARSSTTGTGRSLLNHRCRPLAPQPPVPATRSSTTGAGRSPDHPG